MEAMGLWMRGEFGDLGSLKAVILHVMFSQAEGGVTNGGMTENL